MLKVGSNPQKIKVEEFEIGKGNWFPLALYWPSPRSNCKCLILITQGTLWLYKDQCGFPTLRLSGAVLLRESHSLELKNPYTSLCLSCLFGTKFNLHSNCADIFNFTFLLCNERNVFSIDFMTADMFLGFALVKTLQMTQYTIQEFDWEWKMKILHWV